MKTKIYIIALAAALLLAVAFAVQSSAIHRLTDEKERLENNTEALMTDLEHYIIQDSIHAVKARTLELTIDELKTFRAQDAKIIRDLGIKNRNLESMLTASAETIRELEGQAADTVIVTREVRDTLKRIAFSDKWLDVNILLQDSGKWSGGIVHRLDLAVAVETRYKRFLGFLWRTNQVDHREVHVTAPGDPYTKIQDVTFIDIEL